MDLTGSRGRTKNAYGNSFKMRGSWFFFFFWFSYFRKVDSMFLRLFFVFGLCLIFCF